MKTAYKDYLEKRGQNTFRALSYRYADLSGMGVT